MKMPASALAEIKPVRVAVQPLREISEIEMTLCSIGYAVLTIGVMLAILFH
jgi:hypothetical protein